MKKDEAREFANQFGSRMCDENGETHGEELYCFSLEDIIAIKEALAQTQEQDGECKYCTDGCPACDARKLPAQRTWVGLTADEIWDEWLEQSKPERNTHNFVVAFTRAIEAKLKEKNT